MSDFFSTPTLIAAIIPTIITFLISGLNEFLSIIIFYIISLITGFLILYTFNDDYWKCGDNGKLSFETDSDKENIKDKAIETASSTWIIPLVYIIIVICERIPGFIGVIIGAPIIQAIIIFLVGYTYYGIFRSVNC